MGSIVMGDHYNEKLKSMGGKNEKNKKMAEHAARCGNGIEPDADLFICG